MNENQLKIVSCGIKMTHLAGPQRPDTTLCGERVMAELYDQSMVNVGKTSTDEKYNDGRVTMGFAVTCMKCSRHIPTEVRERVVRHNTELYNIRVEEGIIVPFR